MQGGGQRSTRRPTLPESTPADFLSFLAHSSRGSLKPSGGLHSVYWPPGFQPSLGVEKQPHFPRERHGYAMHERYAGQHCTRSSYHFEMSPTNTSARALAHKNASVAAPTEGENNITHTKAAPGFRQVAQATPSSPSDLRHPSSLTWAIRGRLPGSGAQVRLPSLPSLPSVDSGPHKAPVTVPAPATALPASAAARPSLSPSGPASRPARKRGLNGRRLRNSLHSQLPAPRADER